MVIDLRTAAENDQLPGICVRDARPDAFFVPLKYSMVITDTPLRMEDR